MSEEWNNVSQPTEPPVPAEPQVPTEPQAPVEPPVPAEPQVPAEPPVPPQPPVPPTPYARYTPYQPPQPAYQPPQPPQRKKGGNTWWIVLISVLGAISVLAVALSLGQWNGDFSAGLSNGTTTTTTKSTQKANAPTIRYEEYEDTTALSTVDIVQKNLNATVLINVYSEEKTDQFGYDGLVGQGSGIVWGTEGYLITNEHVVIDEKTAQPHSRIEVEFYDGTVYKNATLVGHDTDTDLAVLKLEPKEGHTLAPVEFGRSDQLLLGERVVTIGASGGLAWSVSEGILSGKDRDVYDETGYDIKCLQVDATINPGNSGGPLFNAMGQLIGINSAKIVLQGYENLGFSIPITEAQKVLEDLATYGKVKGRISLGIRGSDVASGSIAGFMIRELEADSSFDGSKVQVGDIISAVDGVKVSSRAELRKQLSQHKGGDQVTLTITRVKRVGSGFYSTYETSEFTVKITLKEE